MSNNAEEERALVIKFVADMLGIDAYAAENVRGEFRELAQAMIWNGWRKS